MRFPKILYLLCGQQQLSSAFPSIKHRDSSGDWDWDAALEKANDFVAQLTLEEKVGMVTGGTALDGLGCVGNLVPVPHAGFGGACFSDGPTGVNRADLVSVFPAGLTAAATWDRSLMYQRGVAIGEEFRAKGAHVYLGPVAGPLGRHPLGGRNWEGFAADPYLTGVAMNSTICGVQRVGVQTSSKHYIGNEQEVQRSSTTAEDGTEIAAISSNIGDRTLHEVYLWPFADAVRANTSSVMCSYNRLNQTYACENSAMLDDVLKRELGFQGYVVSDWGATHSTSPSMNSGLDLEMPGNIAPDRPSLIYYFGANLTEAVENGSVPLGRLDDAVRRVALPYFALEQDSGDYPSIDPSSAPVLAIGQGIDLGSLGIPEVPARDVRGNHSALIREIAAAGTVLLKNVNSTLPLNTPMNIGVFGNDASDPVDGLVWVQDSDPDRYGFETGTLDIGGGSGTVRHRSIVAPLEAIKARAKTTDSRVQYVMSNERLAANDLTSIYPTPDICLVFLKTWATEGRDRLAFDSDWNSTLVVNNVADRCNNTVVITHSAGVNTLPWAGHPNVKAILAAHYPGEQSGNSIVDVLWGDVNPSGKLPYTIPEKESDYDFPIVNLTDVPNPEAWQSDFDEGLLIDYRHFDAHNITPLYEFGFGLSYTSFELSSPLKIETLVSDPPDEPNPVSGPASPGGNPALYEPLLKVNTSVSNTGDIAGATVAQLYLAFPQDTSPSGTPPQVLRGFEKVYLEAGASNDVSFELTRRDLSYWDVEAKTWRIPSGNFEFRVGFSSRDVKETEELAVLQ